MDQDEAPNVKQVEVSVGWSTSSPKPELQLLPSADSDQQTTPVRRIGQNSNSNVLDSPSWRSPEPRENPSFHMLGKYSNVLGSSPPRPKVKIRKRSSPVKKIKQLEIARTDSDDFFKPNTLPLATATSTASTATASSAPPSAPPSIPTAPSVPTELSAPTGQNEQLPTLIPPDPLDFSSDTDLEDLMMLNTVEYKESYFRNKKVYRYVVEKVIKSEKSILITATDTLTEVEIELEGSWTNTVVQRGDMVHYIDTRKDKLAESKIYINDNTESFFVVNPDILVSCTAVAESLNCERQVVLSSRVRAPSDLNQNLVLGSIKHELLQKSVQENALREYTEMLDILRTVAQNYIMDLSLVELSVDQTVELLKDHILLIQKWASQIWGPQAKGRSITTIKGQKPMLIRLERAIDIEEEIRSPFWGLVGKIDVTAEAVDLNDKKAGKRLAGLEIKTGKGYESTTHIAQTIFYSILLAERHPNNTHPWCLLYYTGTGSTRVIRPHTRDIRALVQRRNLVARSLWLLSSNQLPDPVSATDMSCKWCGRQESCVLYTATHTTNGPITPSALETVYTKYKESGKLTNRFLQFVQHWQTLLDLESGFDSRYSNLKAAHWWTKKLCPRLWSPLSMIKQDDMYQYTLRHADTGIPLTSTPINFSKDSEIGCGDRLILSSKKFMGVSFGVCLESSDKEVQILLDKPLMMSGKYRIDLDLYVSDHSLSLAKFNLHSLLSDDKLRGLIVDLRKPEFIELNTEKFNSTVERASTKVLTVSNDDFISSDEISPHSNLNNDQTNALNKVLGAQDYALILGMPGTGKTTTIAAIVSALVERGKTVLISAYTNSAVDTVVQKLVSADVDCVRFVRSKPDSVNPLVRQCSVVMNRNGTEKDLKRFMESPVVACTSHATNNQYFSLRHFDVCILDEASQITLPFCLGPLRLATTFVLVGDHFQLPPLVRNTLAKERGLDESLFKILCEAHPSAVVELRRQYRMCADIMSLANELVYGGRLVCGNDDVADQKLVLPNISLLGTENKFMFCCIPENKVVFIDTDCLGPLAWESEAENGVSNPCEASIVAEIIKLFEHAGAELRNMAVISVYRRQIAFIQSRLNKEESNGLEIITADQAQGRDKDCIIVSLVRSNEDSRTGELLKEWRRLNVAFTRAKEKLIIIGSGRTMQQADGVRRFYNYIKSRNWVYPSPPVTDLHQDSIPKMPSPPSPLTPLKDI